MSMSESINLPPPTYLTDRDIEKWIEKINDMIHEKMVLFQRYAPFNHPVFFNPILNKKFNIRFERLGGITPEIEKQIANKFKFKEQPLWPERFDKPPKTAQ